VRAVELFCGAGGMSRGLIQSGIDVIKAYDAWPVAVDTYRENIGPHAEVRNLADLLVVIPEIARLSPDLVCGGPPCQDYSTAGRREEGENASMTIAFAVIVSTTRPEWFLMENVVQAEKSQAWAEARELLKRAGYGISTSKTNASLYGVPQSRRRLFIIGKLGERDSFIESAVANAASAQPMTLREFFGSTAPGRSIRLLPKDYAPQPDDAALLENGYVYSRPLRAGRGVRSVDEPIATITRTSWERPTPRYLNAPHAADPVPAQDTAVLTIDQIARIQGFPLGWRWMSKTKRDKLQLIANAVPAPVAKALGIVILARHRGQSIPAIQGRFLDWLEINGRSRASARNVKSLVNRARRLLGGRTFANKGLETLALEAADGFQNLSKGTRSDLRRALQLLAEFENSKRNCASKSARLVKPKETPISAPAILADAA
jgi:DNA (cytosine-5)-methyltransferase 1